MLHQGRRTKTFNRKAGETAEASLQGGVLAGGVASGVRCARLSLHPAAANSPQGQRREGDRNRRVGHGPLLGAPPQRTIAQVTSSQLLQGFHQRKLMKKMWQGDNVRGTIP